MRGKRFTLAAIDTISDLLNVPEGENIEFKEAKNTYEFNELVRYSGAVCWAMQLYQEQQMDTFEMRENICREFSNKKWRRL